MPKFMGQNQGTLEHALAQGAKASGQWASRTKVEKPWTGTKLQNSTAEQTSSVMTKKRPSGG
jgi:hypothetical protein